MQERLVPIHFDFAAVADADSVYEIDIPVQCTIVGVEYTLHTVTGSPTGANIDIQDDGTDAITAIALAAFTALSKASWKSIDMGGANAPVEVAAGSILAIDLNLAGGTSPTAGLNGDIWVLLGGQKA